MEEQKWHLYEHRFTPRVPICSIQFMQNFSSVEEAQSAISDLQWIEEEDTLRTQPIQLQSGKLKYYSIQNRTL